MYPQTKIYFRIKQVTLKDGITENLRFEIRRNEDLLTITDPFQDYVVFPVKLQNTDQNFKMTFKQADSRSTEIDFVIPSTVLSKEREKEKSLTFNIGKLSGTAIVSVSIITENSQKDKTFLTLNKKTSTNSDDATKSISRPSNQKNQPTQGDNKGFKTVQADKIMKPVETENIVKLEQKNLMKSDKSFSDDEEDNIKEETSEKKELKSETIRKSLKINLNEFTFNTQCKRCNYLEKMIEAQGNDIKILQNQIECFMKGNFENPNKESELLESENLLKEPIFNKLFDSNNINFEEISNQTLKTEESKVTSSKKSVSKYNSNKTSAEKDKYKISLQKPGESVDVLVLDDFREKRIQKYEQEIDNLKAQLFAVLKQKKAMEFIRIENESLRSQISRAEAIRLQLEEKMLVNNNSYQSKLDITLNDLSKAFKEKNIVQEKYGRLEIQYSSIKLENDVNMKKLSELEQKLISDLANANLLKNFKETISSLKDDYIKQEKSRVNLQEDFRKSINETNNKLEEFKRENTKLFTENNVLSSKIKELENSLFTKSREIAEKQKKLLELEGSMISVKNDQIALNEVTKHRDELTTKFNRIMEINYNLNEENSKLNISYQEQNNLQNDKFNILVNTNKNIKDALNKKEIELSEKSSTINEKTIEIEKLKLEINSQEVSKLYELTNNDCNRVLQEVVKAIFEFNGKIVGEINDYGDYMIKQADKNMTAQHYIRKLMKTLYEKELELKEARKYIDYNKYVEGQPIYIPLKEDNIDVRLAELINDYPSRSRIKGSFTRESRGNYKYGSKKVVVTIESNKVFLKTSNLLLSFDDFIDKFGSETISLEKENKTHFKKTSLSSFKSVSPK